MWTRYGTYRSLDRVLNQISQQNAGVVVLLDEFELLAANPQLTPYFFARLRGLTTKYGLAYLTASQRPLFDMTADEEILSSPFFNIFVTLPLGLYSERKRAACCTPVSKERGSRSRKYSTIICYRWWAGIPSFCTSPAIMPSRRSCRENGCKTRGDFEALDASD
jgi:hypothetical protein